MRSPAWTPLAATRPLAPLAPSLRQIHETGLGAGHPASVCARFAEYRILPPRQRHSFHDLWTRTNEQARFFRDNQWSGQRDFLDPGQPLLFERMVAADIDAHDSTVALHHDLKRRLAAEGLNGGVAGKPASAIWVKLLEFEDASFYTHGRENGQHNAFCRLDAALVWLEFRNPASLEFMADRLARTRWKNKRKLERWQEVVAHTVRDLRRLPDRTTIDGPLLAVHYREGMGRKALARAASLTVPARIICSASGRVEIKKNGPLNEPPLQGRFAPDDIPLIEGFLEACRSRRPNDPRGYDALAASLVVLAGQTPETLPSFAGAVRRWDGDKDTRERAKISAAVKRAAGFVGRHTKTGIAVGGQVFDGFYLHYGHNKEMLRVAQAIVMGRVCAVHFEPGGRVRMETRPPLGRKALGLPSLPPTAIEEYPAPGNGWGESDRPRSLLDSERTLARTRRNIERLWETVEKAAGVSPTGMLRRTGLENNFFDYRSGQQPLPGRCLHDEFLIPLGFTTPQAASMRRLQVARHLAAGLLLVSATGPYLQQGLLWRHLRIVAEQRRSHDISETLKKQLGLKVHWHHYETGWFALRRREEIIKVAETLGVPAEGHEALADYLMTGMAEVDARIAGVFAETGPDSAATFPNPAMTRPFAGWTRDNLHDEIKRVTREIRKTLEISQSVMARRLRLPGHRTIRSAEDRGFLAPRLLMALRKKLGERPVLAPLIARLALVRATLSLHYDPVPEVAALRPAGELLRFCRGLVPDLTTYELWLTLKERVPIEGSHVYFSFYEIGLARMPDPVLKAFAGLLIESGALTDEAADRLVRKIRNAYAVAGVEARGKKPAKPLEVAA